MVEQPGAEHLRRQRERRLVRVQVQRRRRDDTPQRGDDRIGLPVLAQEGTQRLRVERRVGRIEPAQRQRTRNRPRPVGYRRAGGSRRARPRGAAARARPVAGDSCALRPPGARIGMDSLGCSTTFVLAAEAAHQLAVGLAAAQEHVLAVVDRQLAPPERERGAAQSRAPFDELNRRARVGQAAAPPRSRPARLRRRSRWSAHAQPLRASARVATRSLSRVGSAARPCITMVGSAAMRLSSSR